MERFLHLKINAKLTVLNKKIIKMTTSNCNWLAFFSIIYGFTVINIPIGIGVGIYYAVKVKSAKNYNEKVDIKTLRDCWFLSAVPIVGPFLGLIGHAIGNKN